MRSRHWFAAEVTLLLVAGSLFLVHAQTNKRAAHDRLIGAWRMVSFKYRDAAAFTDVPEAERTHLKYFTGSRFIWVDYDSKTKEMQSAAGGKYVLEGNVLKETPEFGLGTEAADMRDREQTFSVKIEGDTYRQSGTLVFGGKNPENMKLEEVWKRVK